MSASRTALSDAVGLRVEEQVAQMVPGATGCGIFGCIYKDIYIYAWDVLFFVAVSSSVLNF